MLKFLCLKRLKEGDLINQIHTLIVSPKYRPYQDGLSDYVYFFFNQLKKNNLKVSLITSADEKIKEYSRNDHDIYPLVKNWDFFGPMKIFKLIQIKNPQFILVEYVPQMYARAGLNIFFPYYVLIMKFVLKKNVILMAHELNYPFQNNLKTGIFFCWHTWNLFILSISSNKIFTTTENFIKILKRFPFTAKKINLLPVGPNISRIKSEPVKTNIKNLILFGSLHPSRSTDEILYILTDYFKNNANHPFFLHIVGPEKEEVLSSFSMINHHDRHYLLDKTIFHGKLKEEEIAVLFSQGHFGINYFVDGISCRRGSAIAALNLGLPIISNYTERSDSIFLNRPMIFFTKLEEFAQCLKKISTIKEEEYEDLRMKSFQFVDDNFSWEKVCKLYLKYIT